MRSIFLKCTMLLMFLLEPGCNKSTWYNNVGIFKMYTKTPLKAKTAFTKALLINPENAIARYNLSISNLHLQKLNDSLKELNALQKVYETDSRFKNSKELFNVYFAQAFLLGLIQDVSGALSTYQKALKIDSSSVKVKNNIEILTKKGSGKKSGDSDKKKKGKKGESKDKASGGEKDNLKGLGEKDKIQGQDDSSLKKKNLSKAELEQILKEIKDQESKVRAKENKKNEKKGGGNEKTW